MKLTWFGSTCLRVHTGGAILVFDPDRAPAGIDRGELVAGADRVVETDTVLPAADAGAFRPRPAQRLIDEAGEPRPPELWQLGPGAVVVDTDGERPLVMVRGSLPELGRWAERAVVVLMGEGPATRIRRLVDDVAPRLVALAAPEADIDAVFAALAGQTGETALLALEPALAVEC